MQYAEDCVARTNAASDAQLASDQSLRICNEVTGRKKSNMKGLSVIVRLRQPESSALFSCIWVMRARMTNP